MGKPIISRHWVDNVPIIIRPQFLLYGYGLGLLLFFYLLILRVTTNIKIVGREKLIKNSNHIFSLWHSFVPLSLLSATPLIPAVLDRAPQAWMQHPVGMKFNPNTARNEMVNFWDVLFSPVAVNKFLHTITSGYVLAAIVVIGISAWS